MPRDAINIKRYDSIKLRIYFNILQLFDFHALEIGC